jgi:hypothetical protein
MGAGAGRRVPAKVEEDSGLLAMARAQRMNTEFRQAAFCAIMGAEVRRARARFGPAACAGALTVPPPPRCRTMWTRTRSC